MRIQYVEGISVTLKSRSGVTEGRWKRHHLIGGLISGNALASINVIALRQTRLVPGWVTVYGRVNHLGM